MSWGYKILILYAGFVLMILFMVFLSYRQDIPLVTPDYYQQELKYQEEINMFQNARALPNPISIEYFTGDQSVHIQYPREQSGEITGEIYMVRPSDPSLDTRYSVNADQDRYQRMSTGGLQKGYWKLKIYWEHANIKYLEEKDIIIQ